MQKFSDLQLYINHTCDLACPNCITFNNLDWNDDHNFKQLEPEIEKWRGKVEFEEIYLLGGEPLLHPDVKQWMLWVESMWPDSKKFITTNGRHFARLDLVYPDWDSKWRVEISVHSKEDYDTAIAYINQKWNNVVLERFKHPEAVDAYYKHLVTSNGEWKAILSESWDFYEVHSNVILEDNKPISWKQLNDPAEQWNKCPGKKCKYMVNGKLYQCPIQAIVPQLGKSYKVDEKFYSIVKQDFGCTADEFDSWLEKYYAPNQQCSLCDWSNRINLSGATIFKKIKAVKL